MYTNYATNTTQIQQIYIFFELENYPYCSSYFSAHNAANIIRILEICVNANTVFTHHIATEIGMRTERKAKSAGSVTVYVCTDSVQYTLQLPVSRGSQRDVVYLS
jgi:hypothetical protein